jgi:hypothetical protein
MAEAYKVLGQSKPAAATLTDLYTVPASTSTIVSTLTIANQSATADTVRVSVAPGGAADATSQYVVYGATVNGNDTIGLSYGLTLATTDKIRVYSTNGTTAFHAYGVEIS